MLNQKSCFIKLKATDGNVNLPERFTYPFCYQPHALCLQAAETLQTYLTSQNEWQHDFGLAKNSSGVAGKMFGVLIVENEVGELGFLSAFSGQVANKQVLPPFVPPVFDMQENNAGDYFTDKQKTIEKMTEQLSLLKSNPKLLTLTNTLENVSKHGETLLQEHRSLMVENRKKRKVSRAEAEQALHDGQLTAENYKDFSIQMSRESVQDKHALSALKERIQKETMLIQEPLSLLLEEIENLTKQRKKLSNRVQKSLFQQYDFLNALGESNNLLELFKDTILQKPPAGAGDCAAPKLLQYAFLNNYKPIAMAEFWWGASPKSEIRQHLQFYPACQGKCQPILSHMLKGLDVDPNPLIENPADGIDLPIVFQDDDIVIVNKPAGLLSVPGKLIEDSVFTRIKQQFPQAKGSLIVHRLDMATSGLLILALNAKSHKKLQQQFINKTVKKRYVAIIEGELKNEGSIELPLTVDMNDRPRQLVSFEHGKKAFTEYELFQPSSLSHPKTGSPLTKVHLYPKTGRTHQLRVHCAHVDGLNMPILGDELYGNSDERLHLHAEFLSFEHPRTKESMEFTVEADF